MIENQSARCSFCARAQGEVAKVIAGPRGSYICDECVDLCKEVLGGQGTTGKAPVDALMGQIEIARADETYVKCSFCGESIKNPTGWRPCGGHRTVLLVRRYGSYICDECVDLCNSILRKELHFEGT